MFVHPWNAPVPRFFTSFPIVTPVISVRPANAFASMFMFPVISISNAPLPHSFEMAKTWSALPVILFMFVHPWNAPVPRLVTSFPIVTPVSSVRPANALGSTSRFPVISISNDLLPHSFEMATTRSTLPVILVNETQPSKTLLPNCATLSGIIMLVSPVHSAKARSPICTPSGIVMFLSPVHSAKAAKPILIMLS